MEIKKKVLRCRPVALLERVAISANYQLMTSRLLKNVLHSAAQGRNQQGCGSSGAKCL